MEIGNNNLEQGWKDSYTLKEYKENKHKIKKLAKMLPKVFEQRLKVETVPGFVLINEGIQYFNNEPVNPCEDYAYKIVKHQILNHERKLRSVFMDKGMHGIQNYIEGIHYYSQLQAKQYPHLYTVKETQ